MAQVTVPFISGSIDCCGIREMAQIQTLDTPKDVLTSLMLGNEFSGGWWRPRTKMVVKKGYEKAFAKYKKTRSLAAWSDVETEHKVDKWYLAPNCAHLFFSDNHAQMYRNAEWVKWKPYGQPMADFITENKLGSVVHIEAAENPNSGNTLEMWVWTPDEDALTEWCDKNLSKKCAYKNIDKDDIIV
jgi:hypothetical protein